MTYRLGANLSHFQTIFQNSKSVDIRVRFRLSLNRRKLRQISDRISFLGTVPWGNISALPTPLLFLFPAWPLLFPPLFHFLCPTNNKRGSRVPNFFPAIGPLQSTGTSCDHKILRCLKLKFWHWHLLERNWPILIQNRRVHFRWLRIYHYRVIKYLSL